MSKVTFFAVMALIVLCVGCESQQDNDLDANKNLVRRFVEISNAAEWDRLAEIVALDFQRHSTATTGPPVRSLDDFVSLQKSFLATFPDQQVRLDNMISEGNFVAIRAAYLGTQTGPMGNLYPLVRGIGIDTGFLGDDFGFGLLFRIIEIQCAETLFGGLLEVLHQTLVTRVVGDHQLKVFMGFN